MSHTNQGPSFALNAAIASAFLMEGLHDVGYDKAIKAWDKGCLEMMVAFSEYAIILERYLEKADPQDFPGMIHYEVTSSFGDWLAKKIVETGNMPDRDEAIKTLAGMLGEFFAQGEPGHSTPELRRGINMRMTREALSILQSVQNGPY